MKRFTILFLLFYFGYLDAQTVNLGTPTGWNSKINTILYLLRQCLDTIRL